MSLFRKHRKKFLVLGSVLSVLIIGFPQWASAVWALFYSDPMIPALAAKFAHWTFPAISLPAFSPYFVTVPLGLVIFGITLWECRKTPIAEAVQSAPTKSDLAAQKALARTTQALYDAMPPKLGASRSMTETTGLAEGLRDQFMTYGENSIYTIAASHTPNGILVSATQNLDRNKALPCRVFLVDLKRIEKGEPCATAALHKSDGAFKYGRVFLDLASGNTDLFFNVPESWWLISNDGPKIRYSWGEHREHGAIELDPGEWVASVEIEVSDSVFKRDITYFWDGFKDPKLITPEVD